MHAVDGVRVGALVVPGFFHRGTNQDSSVAAGDEVDVGSADHVAQDVVQGARYREHLSLDRASGEVMRRKFPAHAPAQLTTIGEL